MGSKHSKIKKTIKKAQKKGRKLPNPKELASCTGKIRHSSYEEAKEKNSAKVGLIRAYKCLFCDYYHVGRNRG